MTAMAILEDRCHQRLRLNEALSYQVFASYVPFTASVAHITLGADCLDQHAAAVLDALLEEVNRLATDGPMGDELAALVQDREALLHEPVTRHELDSAATTALFGGSVQTREQLTSEYTALTSDCVAQALAGVLDTAIVIGPDLEQPPHDLALLTSAHNAPVTGRRYWGRGSKRFARPRRGNIVVSNDGVSFLRGGADNPVTVKFAEVAALLRHNDNLFKLIANDGAWVWFDAARLFRGDQLKAHIEKSVAQELIIPPENEPGDDALNS
jgi:hypothetical protein